MRQTVELSEVFTRFVPAFIKQHPLSGQQLKVINAVTNCRTAALGGHAEACDTCGAVRISYNSCRNRHCPKCGGLKKQEWMEARQAELLPVHYYHLVFTVPQQFNAWMMYNEKRLYDLLFDCAWQTVSTFAADHKYLGAQSAMIAILHTWGQQLNYHPHLHCIVPAGGISRQGQWRAAKRTSGKFLFPVKAMSAVFKAKFLDRIRQLQLHTPPKAPPLLSTIHDLYTKQWIVYAKRPFGGPLQVIEYLGRYTHKVAISNERLIEIGKDYIRFHYKDYRCGAVTRQMCLKADEFIRRWVQHVLPLRFVKIRHYGFLANRDKNKRLCHIAQQTGHPLMPALTALDFKQRLKLICGLDLDKCPHCPQGRMITVSTWQRPRSP